MRRLIVIFALLILYLHTSGRPHTSGIEVEPTRNMILMIVDGTSTSLLSASRWMKYYQNPDSGTLNVDPYLCAMVRSFSSDSPIPDSAPAMSAYVTGMPQQKGNLSIYPKANPMQDLIVVDSTRAYQPLATLLEAASIDQNKSTGLIATVDFCHATPAACAAHSTRRYATADIIPQMVSQRLDVMFGGGNALLSTEMKEVLQDQGVQIIGQDIEAFRALNGGKAWALMSGRNMDYDIDRNDDKQPSLSEMTSKAIELLSKNKNGFFLMVEGSKVDMAAHANDPIGAITDFLAFDKAVGIALDFARRDGNTTVVIMPDHGTSGITLGDRAYKDYTSKGLDSMFNEMVNYRHSALYIEKQLKKADSTKFRSLFKQYTGIELSTNEEVALIKSKRYKQDNYMEVANSLNLLSTISSIMTSRTHIGFTSGNHTGEDVFLAVYHPKNQIPRGVLTNSQINSYMVAAMGLRRPLSALTDELFVKHTDLLRNEQIDIDRSRKYPVLSIHRADKLLLIPAFRSVVYLNGKPLNLKAPTVYMQENDTFYIPANILEYFK